VDGKRVVDDDTNPITKKIVNLIDHVHNALILSKFERVSEGSVSDGGEACEHDYDGPQWGQCQALQTDERQC
jgi:hypothetical protein